MKPLIFVLVASLALLPAAVYAGVVTGRRLGTDTAPNIRVGRWAVAIVTILGLVIIALIYAAMV